MAGRGEVWWIDMPAPTASEPGYTRPVLVVQSDRFNRSRISTVVVVSLSTNLNVAHAPGNVLLKKSSAGLTRDSVVNVSQISAIDKGQLRDPVCRLDDATMRKVDAGLAAVLGL